MDKKAIAVAMSYTDEKFGQVPTPYKIKPAVATVADLPASGNTAGDVRRVTATGVDYYWDGNSWETFVPGEKFTAELKAKLERDVEAVTLTDTTLTLADMKTMLADINTAGRHVIFDTSAFGEQMHLCTIYIDNYQNPTVYRVSDLVTGKFNVGAYSASKTLLSIMQEAVEDYVTITVTCSTKDGVTVTGQTVTLREGTSASAPVYEAKSYNGQPVVFIVPKNFAYYVSVSNTLPEHFAPTTASGIASTATSVSLVYDDASNITTYAGVAGAIASGLTTELIGNVVISDTWTDENGTVYDDPAIVVDVRTVEDADGETHTAAIMQRKWASANPIQFDASEKLAVSGTYESGFYYYSDVGGTITKLVEGTDYQVGDAITGTVYKSDLNDPAANFVKYGYNRYKMSAYRQYLNSEAGVGQWWESQHVGDVAPTQLGTTRGYLAGCSAAMKAAAKPVKIKCYTNSVTDGSVIDSMVDKVWLPSGTEMYGSVNDNEGTYFPYIKTKTGLNAPSNSANEGRIFYHIKNHSSAQWVRLRSASRGTSGSVWIVHTSGNLGNSTAHSAYSCAPAFAIY